MPFWYVYAVMRKFMLELDEKTRRETKRFTGDLAAQGRKMAYCLEPDKPWYVQQLVTSDLGYEANHWDYAAVSAADAALTRDEIFWYPDRHINITRNNIAEWMYGSTMVLQQPGTLSTVMVGGDVLAQYIDQTGRDPPYMRAVVWGQTAVEADRRQPGQWS